MAELVDYLRRMDQDKASDLFITVRTFVCEKQQDNPMFPISDAPLSIQECENMVRALYQYAGRDLSHLDSGDDDFAFGVDRVGRFRVNAYRQRGSLAAVVRRLSHDIPKPEELHIPDKVMTLAEKRRGMVLVTGTAGSGKSTTQACLVDRINRSRQAHIVTLENPIEYLYRNDKSIVTQREVGIDTLDFSTGLRSCLRQAPDVILLGEMRDQETIATAMTAAETGHLVIATLHTRGAANAVDRIVDVFPANQKKQILAQLADVLEAVVFQQLLPDVRGKKVPAFEVMHVKGNSNISSLVKSGDTDSIDKEILAGGSAGMITMGQSILALYQAGDISLETARENIGDQAEWLERQLARDSAPEPSAGKKRWF